ncbi:unnamed protein product [Pedinophyceae sp. YPF-701]|nr:unnamed protein product [Pedinophyceae sp. YPF-701]
MSHVCHALANVLWKRRNACVVVTDEAERLSGYQLFARTVALGEALRQSGLLPGQRVACLALTSHRVVELWLACCAVGAIFVPLNWRWSDSEITHALRVAAPAVLACDEHFIAAGRRAAAACARLNGGREPLYWFLGGHLPVQVDATNAHSHGCTTTEEAIEEHLGSVPGADGAQWLRDLPAEEHSRGALPLELQCAPGGVSLLCLTSGTTGASKAAALTHKGIVFQSACKLNLVGYSSDDVYLHAAPLFHIGGLSSAHAMLSAGGCQVFLPRFQAKDFLHAIDAHRVSAFIAVPTMLSDLVAAAGGRRYAHVTRILVGAGGMTQRQLIATRDLFPRATLYTAYGMTECCSSITFGIADPAVEHSSRDVGVPPAGIEVRVSAPDGGCTAALPHGQEGEVLVRGPTVMAGYFRARDAGASIDNSAVSTDGWFRTGDAGVIDREGVLKIVGRLKDVIRSGGENVFAGEVEEVVSMMAGVADVAALGLPDNRLGERVTVVVVPAPDAGALWRAAGEGSGETKEDAVHAVAQWCRERGLAGFKAPRTVIVRAEPIPRNSMGKIDRARLRKDAMATLAASSFAKAAL